MISIKDLKSRLPAEALLSFDETFSPAIVNRILLAIRSRRKTSFRVNDIKSTKKEVITWMRSAGFKINESGLIPNAFITDHGEKEIMKTALAAEGKIYLQSLTSLLPALILAPQKGEMVLDVAASPGSKTTQMAALMENTGRIDAVEPDFVRMERLKYNAGLLGVNNIHFFQEYGEQFCRHQHQVYDKVLADLPCSGEGRFSADDKNSYSGWKRNNRQRFANLQKKILHYAIQALKPGGVLIYSTCTLNIEENEAVLDEILKKADYQVKILPVNYPCKHIEEYIPPFLQWQQRSFDPSLKEALRFVPSQRLEGFFICRMQRIS